MPVPAFDRKPPSSEAALRWYAKALASPFEADQFTFLWIAIEILCREQYGTVHKQPYRADCGHEIPACPICGTKTDRPIGGTALKRYLQTLGVDVADSKALWKMRQMFHGTTDLTEVSVESLPRLVLVLRSAVTGL